MDIAWKLNYSEYKTTLESLRKTNQYKKTINEPWKEVVYCLCMQNAWLKSQVLKTLALLKLLLVALDPKNKDNSPLSEGSRSTLNELFSKIKFITVDTSGDDDSEIDDSSWTNDRVANFARALHFAVSNRFEGIHEPADEAAKWYGDRDYDVKSSHEAISNLRFRYDKKNKIYTVELTLLKPSDLGAAQKELAKAQSGEYTYKEEKSVWIISFVSPVEWEDFVLSSRTLNWSLVTEMSLKVSQLCEHSCDLYARMKSMGG